MFIATSWTPRYFSSHIPFVFSGTNCPRDNEVEFSSFSKNIKKDMILNEELAWICVNGINDPSLPWTNTWGETPWMDGWKMKLSPFGFYSNLTKKKSAAAAIPSARCRFQWDNLSEAIFVTKKKKTVKSPELGSLGGFLDLHSNHPSFYEWKYHVKKSNKNQQRSNDPPYIFKPKN